MLLIVDMSVAGGSRDNHRNNRDNLRYVDMDWSSRDNHRDMDVVGNSWDRMDMISDSNNFLHKGAQVAAERRCSTSLIRPWVVGEPLRWDKVLATAWQMVHIAPLCSSAINSLTVALHSPGGVAEGDAGALAPTVGVGGGGLCLLHGQAGGAQHQGGQDGHLGEHGEELACWLRLLCSALW